MSDQVESSLLGDVVVATVTGDIDLINHEAVLQRLLNTALDSGPRVVVDLSSVNYVDSNGIRMLFALANELSHSRVQWAIALGSNSPLVRLFKVTAFDEVATILGSVTDAVAAVSRAE